jgi:4-coumarate--CoA ligase
MRRTAAISTLARVCIPVFAAGQRTKIYTCDESMPSLDGYQSITEIFFEGAENNANRVGFVNSHDHSSLTFGDVIKLTHKIAGVLYYLHNIRPKDVVAILLPNCNEYGAVFHSVLRLGAIASTMNPAFTPDEVRKQIQLSGA